MSGAVVRVTYMGIGEMATDVLKCIAIPLTVGNEYLRLRVTGVIQISENFAPFLRIGMRFFNHSQFSVCLFIVSGKLLEPSWIFRVIWARDDLIIVDGHYITAPHVVIPVQECEPCLHSIPPILMLPKDGKSSPFSTNLLEAAI
jgi:hypothetical protein